MEPPHLTEDDTDDSFMKRIILHNRSMSEDFSRPQAFSKATVRPRNRLTLANLERLPNVQPPEPPQVTTKSDLGSIDSEEESSERPVARLKTKLEEIRQREIDVNNEYRSNPIQSPPTPPPQEEDADHKHNVLKPLPLENLARPQNQTVRRKTSKPESVAQVEQVDGESDLIRIRNMGDRLLSMYGNVQEMKSGVDNMQKLAQQAPNGVHTPRTAVSQDERELVWAWLRGWRKILWVSRAEQNSWKRFKLGPGFLVLFILAIPIYALLECIACLIWCRPVAASSMDGFGWYPDAPELPFVIPTMLLRPFRPAWRPLVDVLGPFFSWLARFVTYLATESDGNEL